MAALYHAHAAAIGAPGFLFMSGPVLHGQKNAA
jgi:hypothetical protein